MKYQSRVQYNPNLGKYGVYTAEVRSKENFSLFWNDWVKLNNFGSDDGYFHSRESAEKAIEKFFENIELKKKKSKSEHSWKLISEQEHDV